MNYSNDLRPDGDEKKRSMKGFYIALALCLLAIAGVAVVTLFGDSPDMEGTPTTTVTAPTIITTERPVAGNVTGVPDTRTTTTVKTAAPTTSTTRQQSDLFVFPASNVILCPFSDRLVYSETLGEWRTHNGTDFEAALGEEIKAAADGTVHAVYEDPLWGHVIELDHGDKLLSRYCGVKATGIAAGDTVKAGQVMGTVTEIPGEIADAAHVHVEILANNKYTDPMTLIRGEAIVKTTAAATTTTQQ